jgi:hypothetical protein
VEEESKDDKIEKEVEEKSKDDRVEKGLEEESKDDRKEGGILCHCGTPAKREVVKKEGKNKGNNIITHS